jgi:hypothetical protein
MQLPSKLFRKTIEPIRNHKLKFVRAPTLVLRAGNDNKDGGGGQLTQFLCNDLQYHEMRAISTWNKINHFKFNANKRSHLKILSQGKKKRCNCHRSMSLFGYLSRAQCSVKGQLEER